MKFVLLCTSLFLLFDFSFQNPIIPRKTMDYLRSIKSIRKYLNTYYPLPTLVQQIKAMQKFFHLTVTGIIDVAITKIMELPRCGLPDVQQSQPAQQIWTKKALTYRIINYTPDLPKFKVDEIIPKAFKVWSDVTPLTFSRVYGPADIEIMFASGDHGDNSPFDGKEGTLAHAYLPGDGIGGDAHFDESEMWSETDKDINFYIVCIHEFGHSLGLTHSNDPKAVMAPIYKYESPPTFRLSADDKQRIQRLYGEK